MTNDPRQQIADALDDHTRDGPGQRMRLLLDADAVLAALADAGYVVVHCPEGEARVVCHEEDGTITSTAVQGREVYGPPGHRRERFISVFREVRPDDQ